MCVLCSLLSAIYIIGSISINHGDCLKSYRTGHVLAATWRMPPPGSQHPGPSSTPSSSDKLTLIDRNQVDCGV
jgi:hypothetical protein